MLAQDGAQERVDPDAPACPPPCPAVSSSSIVPLPLSSHPLPHLLPLFLFSVGPFSLPQPPSWLSVDEGGGKGGCRAWRAERTPTASCASFPRPEGCRARPFPLASLALDSACAGRRLWRVPFRSLARCRVLVCTLTSLYKDPVETPSAGLDFIYGKRKRKPGREASQP